jgi:hypothetical protein
MSSKRQFSEKHTKGELASARPLLESLEQRLLLTALPMLSINDVSANEGDSGTTPFDFPVSLSASSTDPVTVNYWTNPGTGHETIDYQGISGNTLTFPPGDTRKTVSVNVIGDTYHEGNDTFTVRLGSPSGATIDKNDGLGTIINDDPLPSFSISDEAEFEGDPGLPGNFIFNVTLSYAQEGSVTVNYATSNGTATAGSDYTTTSATLTFAPGQLLREVAVPVTGDTLFENDETFIVTLSSPSAGMAIDDGEGLGTIRNDDVDMPMVSISSYATAMEGPGAQLEFTVSLSSPSALPVAVYYATSDATGSPSPATAGVDYVPASGTLTILPGDTSTQLTIPILDDSIDEPDESFLVSLTAADNALIDNSNYDGVGTIADDDPAENPLTFSITGDQAVLEGGRADYTISYTGTLTTPVTIQIDTALGLTSTPDAIEDVDFTGEHATLTFNPGSPSSMPYTVHTHPDALVEGDEEFSVSLSNASQGLIGTDQVNTIITDTTPPPPPEPEFSITGDRTVVEGNTASYTVSYVGAPTGDELTVQVDTGLGVDVNVPDATSGVDFDPMSSTLTFLASGPTSVTLQIATVPDALDEGGEEFSVNLSNASEGTIADPLASTTILDEGVIGVMISDLTVTEGAIFTFPVELTAPSPYLPHYPAEMSIPFTSTFVSQTGARSIYPSGDIEFRLGESVCRDGFQTQHTPIAEGDDIWYIHLGQPIIYDVFIVPVVLVANSTALMTILDGPTFPIMSVDDPIAVESDPAGAVFTVSLDEPLPAGDPVTVEYYTADDTAVAGSDYVETTGTLTFNPGEQTATITVPLIDDGDTEPNETFFLHFTNAVGAFRPDPPLATATIVDPASPEFSITGPATVLEGNTADYTVSYTGNLSADTTIQIDTGAGTITALPDATEGVDYGSQDMSITFTLGGPSSTTVSVPTIPDTDVEGDEDFSVSLSNPSTGVIGVGQVSTTILEPTNTQPFVTELTATPDVVDENGLITLTGAFTDPDQGDLHQVTVDWGDGSTPEVVDVAPGERTFQATHQYLDDNPTATPADDYTIGVTITEVDAAPIGDVDGSGGLDGVDLSIMGHHLGLPGSGDLNGDGIVDELDVAILARGFAQLAGVPDSTTTVTVNNVDPDIVNLLADPDPTHKVATVTGSFTDVGTEDTHQVTVEWGDGTPDSILDLLLGARWFEATHNYAIGTAIQEDFTVTVTVDDDDAGTDTDEMTLTVVNSLLIDGFTNGSASTQLTDGEICEHVVETGLPLGDTHGGVRAIQTDWQGMPVRNPVPSTGDFGEVTVDAGLANLELDGDPRFSFGYGRGAGAEHAWTPEDWTETGALKITLESPVDEPLVFGLFLWGELDGQTQLWASPCFILVAGETEVTYDLPSDMTFRALAPDGSTRMATVGELMESVTGLSVVWRGAHNDDAVGNFAIDQIEMVNVPALVEVEDR